MSNVNFHNVSKQEEALKLEIERLQQKIVELSKDNTKLKESLKYKRVKPTFDLEDYL